MWPQDAVIFDLASPLIKQAEGFRSKPYLCPAKKWTIAWGSTKRPNGEPVKPTDPEIDESLGNIYLVAGMSRVLAGLKKLPQFEGRPPTPNQAAALLSLAYNVGVGCHDGKKGDLADSTLLEKYAAGDLEGAAHEFLDWDKAHVDGELVTLAGLTKRRQAEHDLFLRTEA